MNSIKGAPHGVVRNTLKQVVDAVQRVRGEDRDPRGCHVDEDHPILLPFVRPETKKGDDK